ncbi:MAG: hypothetical protein RML93_13205 [Anaerolineales bacterium]|nr:hypothetical protein [Anaerolineales bacterium]MCS7247951.1 hypothetical protein [Anaerolineales bacterium]MDW8161762.1 hypothetical protein [Anaerolineales bacterium]MDW8448231.1 hypothetical protein [Anaerolineales bacterium]
MALLTRLGKANLFLWLMLFVLVTFLLFRQADRLFANVFLRYLAYGVTAALGYLLLHAAYPQKSPLLKLLLSLLTLSAVLHLFYFASEVNTYPFSLDWSETSRYYYASLFLSEKIYGSRIPWSPLHPSRYLLQAVPFFFSAPLWIHRLWQSILWVGLTALGAAALVYRLRLTDRWLQYLALIACFVFFLVGPIYYHLIPCMAMVLFGFSPQPKTTRELILSLSCLILASTWAGLSRINWYPVPGLLASMLYFLEVPFHKSFGRYFSKPFLWSLLGFGTAYLTREAYIHLSGNPAEFFSTSFSSPLLWHRLFPNATYPPGILLGSLGLILPLAALAFLYLHRHWGAINPWRWAAIGAILAVFYLGGVIVSLKIGGGSNLHNLDAFWAFLAVLVGYLFAGKLRGDRAEEPLAFPVVWEEKSVQTLCLLAALVAALHPLALVQPFYRYDQSKTSALLRKMQKTLSQGSPDEEVLLISERHLVTFGYLSGVKLVPDYERVFLMEMVMAGHTPYLQRFLEDIQSRRYKYIVVDPLSYRFAGGSERFGIENNLWVERVALPLLCYYKPHREAYIAFRNAGIQILERRAKPSPKYCKLAFSSP